MRHQHLIIVVCRTSRRRHLASIPFGVLEESTLCGRQVDRVWPDLQPSGLSVFTSTGRLRYQDCEYCTGML